MKMRKMVSVGAVALMAFCSIVLTGCLNDDKDNLVQPVVPVSYVSLYNASPDAPALTIVVDDNQINSRPFRYSEYTGYLPFYTGDRKLQFGPFGANNVAVDTTVHLVDSVSYSIFVADEYSKASVVILQDTASAPAASKAKVRFINLSPDAGALQLSAGGSAIGDAEAFKHASNFISVDAKSYDLSVSGANVSALNVPSVNINDGKFYTVLVRGYKTPPAGNQNVLSVEVLKN